MKDQKLLFLSFLTVAAFVLTGGLALAGGANTPIDPVKTCGVGPTGTSSRSISCGTHMRTILMLATRRVSQTCLPMAAATSYCTTIV